MCPACITTLALIAAATSTGGATALVAKKLRAKRTQNLNQREIIMKKNADQNKAVKKGGSLSSRNTKASKWRPFLRHLAR